ncbi:MAG: serine/threonine-protein kinase [Myxococcota bacterium]
MSRPHQGDDSDERLLARFAAAPPVEPALAPTTLETGDVVSESYRVEGMLGSGGMGVVYRAHDLELDRPVAIKLHTRRTSDSASARLVREAKAMAKLSHPNVLTIYEIGRHQVRQRATGIRQYVLFIAMELVEGTTLRSWIGASERSWAEITRMFVDAGRGLAAAHHAGLVHRDFKPDNVLVDGEGRPRVADFGLARVLDDDTITQDEPDTSEERTDGASTASLTTTGMVLGTRAYMAPEQVERKRELDARVDQYAFCVSLYEGLHGRRPGKDQPRDDNEADEAPRSKRKVPRRLQRALERGLSTDPAERFASMDALLDELQATITPRLEVGLVAVALAAMVGTAGWLTTRLESDPCDPEPRLTAVWSDARGDDVERALSERGGPIGEAAAARVRGRLDGYATNWGQAYQEACAATHERHVQSEEAFDLRMTCLDERRGELASLVEVLEHADPEVAARADRASLSLSSLAPCADLESLRRVEPIDEADRDAVSALSQVLARSRSELNLGRYEASLHRAEAALADAESLGYSTATGRASLAIGDAMNKLERHERAAEAYLDAQTAALRGGDEHTVLMSTLRLVYTEGYQLRHADLGERSLRLVDALLPRLGAQPQLVFRRDLDEGLMLRASGRLDDALRAFEAAMEHAKGMRGDEAHETQRLAASALAVTLTMQGKFDEALGHHDNALHLTETIYGLEHPSVANELNNYGGTQIHRGDYEAALDLLRRSAAIQEVTLPPSHLQVLRVRNNIASTLLQLGRYDEAVEEIRMAIDHSGDAAPRDRSSLRQTLAVAYGELGRHDEAAHNYEIALTLAREDDPDGPLVVQIIRNLARLANNRKLPDEAIARANEGLAIIASSPDETLDRLAPYLRLSLARAYRLKDDWSSAHVHYQQSVEQFEKHLGSQHPHLADPLRGLAESTLKLGDPAAAESIARRAKTNTDDYSALELLLARILWAKGENATARSHASRALELVEDASEQATVEAWLETHVD